jgi:hypothetical protein
MRIRAAALLGTVLVLLLLGAMPASAAGGRTFTTTLLGASEFPGPGDPDGSGTASVTVGGRGELCWSIEVQGIGPIVFAHLHVGTAGEMGPIVTDLMPGGVFAATGCVNIGRAQAVEILKNPAGFYVNVHTDEFPEGALRGQLR